MTTILSTALAALFSALAPAALFSVEVGAGAAATGAAAAAGAAAMPAEALLIYLC